jgi:putative MATE family efflux protein
MVSMGAALRGTGNFKPGMIVSTVTVILNMLLAPVLMFGWLTGRPLGVAGAAISSLVAIVLGTGWLLLYFRPDESYLKVRRADWRPQPAVWKRMLGIGLPAGAEFALMAVYLLVVYGVARPFGAAAQAGFGIGVRIMQSAFLPIVALAFAVAPVAGQNFGARKAERVRETFKVAAAITVATTLAITALCQFAGDAMVHVFSADAGVVAVGDEYLRIVSLSFVCAGLVFIGSSMFQAMGHTLPALLASMIRTVLTVVPALALSRLPGFELRWIWYVAVLASLVHLTVNMLLLRREFRLRFDSPPVALAVQV